MHLSEFMKLEELGDEEMAARIRAIGVGCNRTTISRLRRGKTWPSKDVAAAVKSVSFDRVTIDDFLKDRA